MIPVKMKAYREAKNWSKAELARRATMQPNMIGWIECGRFIPFDSQLEKLAAALGVNDPDELMQPLDSSNELMCHA